MYVHTPLLLVLCSLGGGAGVQSFFFFYSLKSDMLFFLLHVLEQKTTLRRLTFFCSE